MCVCGGGGGRSLDNWCLFGNGRLLGHKRYSFKTILDHTFMENCPGTPPLKQHFA